MKIPTTEIQKIDHPDFLSIDLYIKRDDLIHDQISGNKLYKLIFNLDHAKSHGYQSILTFGGAYSNHIAATASICHSEGIKSIGIIRGEKPKTLNPTLAYAEKCGMHLEYISRERYRRKNERLVLNEFKAMYKDSFFIPEGGSNLLGILGTKKILDSRTKDFDFVVVAMGTGTTFSGIVKAAVARQKIIGIPIHKHENIIQDIIDVYPSFKLQSTKKWSIENGYHCGGYAKWNNSLVEFINNFYHTTRIKLDPIYTGKAMSALKSLVDNKTIDSGSKVLFIHTGGIQGVQGFEDRFGIKLYQ